MSHLIFLKLILAKRSFTRFFLY